MLNFSGHEIYINILKEQLQLFVLFYYKNIMFILLFLYVFSFWEPKISVNQGLFLQQHANFGSKERWLG